MKTPKIPLSISNKLNMISFVNKDKDVRYLKYNPFWNSWTFSLIASAGALCIWAVLFILLNVLWQINYIEVGGNTPIFKPVTGSDLFGPTDYEFWINSGIILSWIIFSISIIAFCLSMWQIYNIKSFKSNVINLIINGYVPHSDIEKNIISMVVGVFNYNNENIEDTLVVGNMISNKKLTGRSTNDLDKKMKSNDNSKSKENKKTKEK